MAEIDFKIYLKKCLVKNMINTNGNFDSILINAYIDTYFQPIVSLENENIIGYEALSRGPKGSPYFLPNALISEAKARNRMQELDHVLRKMTLINASKRDVKKLIFVNVDPIVLYEDSEIDRVIKRCDEYGLHHNKIVVEISEKNVVCSFENFQKLIKSYQDDGFAVALDDINCTLTDAERFSTIKPAYVKIDGNLVKDIDKNDNTALEDEISSIITLAKMVNAKVIAVGVETKGALIYLYKHGVDCIQGNFIGIPQKEPKGILPQAQIVIEDLKAGKI